MSYMEKIEDEGGSKRKILYFGYYNPMTGTILSERGKD